MSHGTGRPTAAWRRRAGTALLLGVPVAFLGVFFALPLWSILSTGTTAAAWE